MDLWVSLRYKLYALLKAEGKNYLCSVSRSLREEASTYTVNSIKLETGLRPNSAGIPYTLLLRTEAIGFPTFGLLL